MVDYLSALGRNKLPRLGLVAVIALAITACSLERKMPPTVEAFASRVHVEEGAPGTNSKVLSSWIDWERANFDHGEEPVRVALISNKEHDDVIMLYVANITRTGGLLLVSAKADGRGIDLEVISRDVQICRMDDCEILEEVTIDFPESELAAAAEAGLTIELVGVLGNVSFKLPGYALQGFLQRYREA